MVSLFLLLWLVPGAFLQEDCSVNSCHPELGDLMVGRANRLSASSTCGLNGPQNYCILGYLEDEKKCFICDSRQSYHLYNQESHRIENVITTFDPERKTKWWQSENGVHEVTIQLDLEALFQFSHLVLTFKSFRPAAMLVERSKDYGQTWKVFRYFAEDCAFHFPWVSLGPAKRIDEVICDDRYSSLEPSTEGEVVLKALDPSFNIDDPYTPHIQEQITLTNLRVKFTRLITLGDTLLQRKKRSPQVKYYYALYEMVVRGSCFCHGHASMCMPVDEIRGDVFIEPGMIHGRCVCQHNTVGTNCERCQEFYNDAPWRPSSQTHPHVCRRCNCHGHSETCHFDMAQYQASGGVSGGVCDNCRHDRVGPHCELCRPYLYQDPRLSLDDPQGCIPCDCDATGSLENGLCDPVSGRCVCKENVGGERCDRCKFGFYGLSQEDPTGCQRCTCNFLGSVLTPYPCDQQTGQCVCQSLAVGPLCDECRPGYWGLGNTVYPCSPCNCDHGGAYSDTCSSVDGQCQCRPNMVNRRCSDPAPGYFLAGLDFYLYEAENAAPLYPSSPIFRPTRRPEPRPTERPKPRPTERPKPQPTDLPACEEYYKQQGYDVKYQNGRFVLSRRSRRSRSKRQLQTSLPLAPGSALQIVPRERTTDMPVTWTGPGFVRVLDGVGLRFTVDNLPESLDYQLVIRYEQESPDDWMASVRITPLSAGNGECRTDSTGEKTLALPGAARVAIMDTRVCLNAGARYYVDITFRKQSNFNPHSSSHILIDSMGLIPTIESVQDFCSQSEVDQFQRFRCFELDSEQRILPDVCEGLIRSLSARIHNGAMVCRCNLQGSHGPSCSKLGGRCDCKPNVIGRCCDSCAPLTYGFGPSGCAPCDCDPRGAIAELCDQVRGQCPCRREVGGRRCDQCLPGYFGFPLCRPCECNSLAELCDQHTGVCRDCRKHSTGDNCERCLDGYFGDPASREPCKPCLCPDTQSSGRFFARTCNRDSRSGSLTCDCLTGHTGARCDACAAGFYGQLTRPGDGCRVCVCNDNADLADPDACDSVTGECLRCRHNTHGAHCQNCKPGYYGNALSQDCRECSCDRRGTEVAQCPLGSRCFCDSLTGQCPCRSGVVGVLCDECADGFWNLQGGSGCQPCQCDPANSLSNHCDKVTGQCQCRAEFGGRRCDGCGENHFGNPDLQCVSCDCNMDGTDRPACDPFTGECLCRVGVMGIFCDECAPGYDQAFPACTPCHPCALLVANEVHDVHLDVQRMRTLVSRHSGQLKPEDGGRLRRMLEMQSKLDSLANLTGNSVPRFKAAENLFVRLLKLKDTIDPNTIIIDPTSVLNTEINNIRHEFTKLLNNFKHNTSRDPGLNTTKLQEILEKIRKHHADFLTDQKQVKEAERALEDSMDTRQEIKNRLANCNSLEEMEQLENKVKALSVVNLNEKICGASSDDDCSKSECGGALCPDRFGERACGGPTCDGSVPISQNATEIAEQGTNKIFILMSNLLESKMKINTTQLITKNTQELAEELMKNITDSKQKFEREKDYTKDLIKRVKDFLTSDMVAPGDIEKVAKAVLDIQLPGSPGDVRSLVQNIRGALDNFTKFDVDLKNLEDQTKVAHELRDKAMEVRDRAKGIDVTDIKNRMEDATNTQRKVERGLEKIKQSNDTVFSIIEETEKKINNSETNLKSTRPTELLKEINALKNKTEMNREQTKQAQADANTALDTSADAEKDLEEVTRLFNMLKEGNTTQDNNDVANERLKNITMEAKKLQNDLEDKLQQIDELEKMIKDSIKTQEDQADTVAMLLNEVTEIKANISSRVEGYFTCRN
ncbi:laminin subunit beta-4 [Esox lucius]|uniref:Uncharacterized protein n=1 Tax=Esox lucius TaxID=8010 RepID=A0A3P8YKY4_ESOLU|nr:laminin subunit beta-4 [Esox lucius]XP_034144340.1 laminin subunit beta-4 [Esox lucius]XP_034144341.1 laminin subunit beta-4 [Esox lucius]